MTTWLLRSCVFHAFLVTSVTYAKCFHNNILCSRNELNVRTFSCFYMIQICLFVVYSRSPAIKKKIAFATTLNAQTRVASTDKIKAECVVAVRQATCWLVVVTGNTSMAIYLIASLMLSTKADAYSTLGRLNCGQLVLRFLQRVCKNE